MAVAYSVAPLVPSSTTFKVMSSWVNSISQWNYVPRTLILIVLTTLATFYDTFVKLKQYEDELKIDRQIQLYLEKHNEAKLVQAKPRKEVVIITGATSGIGLETLKLLSLTDYYIVLACRDEVKSQTVIQKINENSPKRNENKLSFIYLDLASLNSVDRFVTTFNSKFPTKEYDLKLLLNNAGQLNFVKSSLTVDGIESQLQVNYFAHYLLTTKFLPNLKESESKIIFLGSLVHYGVSQFDRTSFHYNPDSLFTSVSDYYQLGKFCCVSYAHYLRQNLKDTSVKVYVADPGTTDSHLFQNLLPKSLTKVLILRSSKLAALTSLKLVLSDNKEEECFYCLKETWVQPNNLALDKKVCELLVNISEEFVSH